MTRDVSDTSSHCVGGVSASDTRPTRTQRQFCRVRASEVLGFTARVLGKMINMEKGETREVEEGHDSFVQCLLSSLSELPPPPPSSPSDYSDNGNQGAEDYVGASNKRMKNSSPRKNHYSQKRWRT